MVCDFVNVFIMGFWGYGCLSGLCSTFPTNDTYLLGGYFSISWANDTDFLIGAGLNPLYTPDFAISQLSLSG
jgi:hypothetical protein